LLVDKAARLQMSYSVRERFMQQFTLAKYYDGLTGIFEQALHGPVRK